MPVSIMARITEGAVRVRELQVRHTGRAMAATLGVTNGAVSLWANGHRKPGLTAAMALEHSYGIPLHAWLREATERSPSP